jgi:hypothetical protein
MRAGFWRACALALLLLFVQQLALTHVLEHVAADTLQFVPEGDAGDCPECLALGGLQPGGTTTGKPWSATGPSEAGLAFAFTAGPARRVLIAHAIRAPPENRD